MTPCAPSLDWLIAPADRREFFLRNWENETLVVRRNEPDYYASLLSFDDIDRVLTTMDRRHPDIVLKNANDPNMVAADYTLPGGRLDIAKVYQLFHQGATIALSFLDTVLPKLTVLCRTLEQEFSSAFQTNIYMTPPRAQGAKPHYDTHDVFVLQVTGSKKWRIFGTPLESPLQSQSFDASVHDLGPLTMEFELNAGDMAYIPRGVGHEAIATDTVSLHITTGLLRTTWVDFLLEYVSAAALEDAKLRKALPAGFARSGFNRQEVRDRVQSLLDRLRDSDALDKTLDTFVDRFLSRCPPVLEGQMQQWAALDLLNPDSLAGVRPGLVFRTSTANGSLTVESYGRRVTVPEHAAAALEFALAHCRFRVGDLPGELDEAGKVTLVRRLIREGLVRTF